MVTNLRHPTAPLPVRRVELTEWDQSKKDELSGYHLPSDAAVRTLVRRLHDSGNVRLLELVEGLQIETRSYVGRLRLGDLDLIIRPKVSASELTALIVYAFSLSSTEFYGIGRQFCADLGIADILSHQFADETEHLVRGGLTQQYVRRFDQLTFPRGRINFSALARQPHLSKAALPCNFQQRTADWELNRLLAVGLTAVSQIATDPWLRQRLARLTNAFPFEVSDLKLTAARVGRALDSLDRLTDHYRPALQLLALLADGGSVLLENSGAEREGIYSFLFDMNMLFQRLLGRLFRENLEGFDVISEFGLSGCLRYVPGFNPRGRASLSPRPDYAIRKDKKIIALLDAKYRDLWTKKLP
jgi:5-methylcytosine-specific restriction enzyme subunit McrC